MEEPRGVKRTDRDCFRMQVGMYEGITGGRTRGWLLADVCPKCSCLPEPSFFI